MSFRKGDDSPPQVAQSSSLIAIVRVFLIEISPHFSILFAIYNVGSRRDPQLHVFHARNMCIRNMRLKLGKN